jgi:hypothetical protein
MQIFIMVLINVFMGGILYLLICLKLERSAAEFRQKRLQQEIDEMIQEFNSAAERNISLLEQKITVARRLIERTGDARSVDFLVDDEKALPVSGTPAKEVLEPSTPAVVPSRDGGYGRELKKGLRRVKKGIIHIAESVAMFWAELMDRSDDESAQEPPEHQPRSAVTAPRSDRGPVLPGLIEKDYDMLMGLRSGTGMTETAVTEEAPPLSESDIAEMFRSTDDRYGLVRDLHGMGYTGEALSRYSGIPVGEISLIVNLK